MLEWRGIPLVDPGGRGRLRRRLRRGPRGARPGRRRRTTSAPTASGSRHEHRPRRFLALSLLGAVAVRYAALVRLRSTAGGRARSIVPRRPRGQRSGPSARSRRPRSSSTASSSSGSGTPTASSCSPAATGRSCGGFAGLIRVHYAPTSRTVDRLREDPAAPLRGAALRDRERPRPGHLADRARPARRPRGSRQGPPAGRRSSAATATGSTTTADAKLDRVAADRPGRGRELLSRAARPRPVRPVRRLVLRADPAADPRDRLQRLPALAPDLDFPDDRPDSAMPSERDRRAGAERMSRVRRQRRRVRPPDLPDRRRDRRDRPAARPRPCWRDGARGSGAGPRPRSAAAAILGPEVELFEADLDAGSRPRRGDGRRRARLLPRPHARQRPRLRRSRACRRRDLREARRPQAGVGRMVYLGGLGADHGGSPHLDSRHRTAEALRELGPAADLLPGGDDRRPRQRVLRAAALDRQPAAGPARSRTGCARRPSRSGSATSSPTSARRRGCPASAGREIQIGGPDVDARTST